jgi:hypothetical protein
MVIAREGFYELGGGGGFLAAEAMIEVKNQQSDAEILAERFEQTEERNGIGAAGDAHADTIAGQDDPHATNGLEELQLELRFHTDDERILTTILRQT